MANTHTTLTSLFTDIAKAIRKAKTGSETGTAIVADNFPTAISGITYRGAVTSSLNAGGSYTIPAGYHNGSGKITANSLSSQTAGTASAGEILSGKTAYVYGSKLTGTMTNRGAVTATLDPGGTYTIPAGYHNGQGRITAIVGYALSGDWELDAASLYNKKGTATMTQTMHYEVYYGPSKDGTYGEYYNMTHTSGQGVKCGSNWLFSCHEYTTYGNGWWDAAADVEPVIIHFYENQVVTEAFYNWFTSVATQVSSSDNSIPTGTLTITNGKAYNFNIILPQYVNGNLVTTYEYSAGTGSGNITYNNVVLNMPITWFASGIKLVTSSSFSNKFDDYVYSSGYKVTMVYNLLASSATVSVTTYDCCFAPESQVLMADGNTKAVVDVEIGDKVLTYNEISGEQETNEVTALGNVKLQDYTQITMANGDIIKMNKYHPLWTEDGWKSLTRHENMPELTESDKLLTTNGEYMAIDSIETINDMELKTYYTLKVANNNNFYVNGYLAQGKDKD